MSEEKIITDPVSPFDLVFLDEDTVIRREKKKREGEKKCIVVAGDDNFTDYDLFCKIIADHPDHFSADAMFVCGNEEKLDKVVLRYAEAYGMPVQQFSRKEDLSESTARKQQRFEMAEYASQVDGSTVLILTNGTNFLRDMLECSSANGLYYFIVNYENYRKDPTKGFVFEDGEED